MPKKGDRRLAGEIAVVWTHRTRTRRIREFQQQIGALEALLAIEEDAHRQAVTRLSRAFGRNVADVADPDGYLLDCLERIEVMPDGGWRWLGPRNNKGLPVIKATSREMSVRRYLAVCFGVVGIDDECILYPDPASARCGYPDVNPFRCTPRMYGEGKARRGNPARFLGSRTPLPSPAETV